MEDATSALRGQEAIEGTLDRVHEAVAWAQSYGNVFAEGGMAQMANAAVFGEGGVAEKAHQAKAAAAEAGAAAAAAAHQAGTQYAAQAAAAAEQAAAQGREVAADYGAKFMSMC